MPILQQRKLARTQYRQRYKAVRPVIVLHTAENTPDVTGADPTAEAVTNFITNRKDPGSYHIVVDRDSWLHLIDYRLAAFGDGTGSNEFAIHLSIAANTKVWKNHPEIVEQYLQQIKQAMGHVDEFLITQGLKPIQRRKLSKTESDRWDANGFIAHSDRDPARRSDPGRYFPWNRLFQVLNGETVQPQIGLIGEALISDTAIKELQTILGVTPDGIIGPITRKKMSLYMSGYAAGYDNQVSGLFNNRKDLTKWIQRQLNRRGANLTTDGDFGPKTSTQAAIRLHRNGIVAADSLERLTENSG